MAYQMLLDIPVIWQGCHSVTALRRGPCWWWACDFKFCIKIMVLFGTAVMCMHIPSQEDISLWWTSFWMPLHDLRFKLGMICLLLCSAHTLCTAFVCTASLAVLYKHCTRDPGKHDSCCTKHYEVLLMASTCTCWYGADSPLKDAHHKLLQSADTCAGKDVISQVFSKQILYTMLHCFLGGIQTDFVHDAAC